jgi:hypothetical protein
MKNYHFSKTSAKKHSVEMLFLILLVLIETQLQAARYRLKLPNTLTQGGICDNVYTNLEKGAGRYRILNDYDLGELFFNGLAYPITPYSLNGPWSANSEEKEYKWGDTDTGDRRMLMLARMIKDLTNYLTHEAVL